jgi:hypothetical protein
MTFWKKYSLGITLLVLFIAAWAIMTWTDWAYFVAQQAEHHQPADVFGSSGYIWRWGSDTFSNWQADFLGQTLAVVLGAYLIFQGSAQSKDSSEQVQQLVQDFERQVRGSQAASQAESAAQATIYRGGNLRNYGLGYLLIGGFLVSWALMTWMAWMNFAAGQHEHGQTAALFGGSGYLWQWATLTLENWQSDIMGSAVTAILGAYLLYKGSAESRGSDDEIEQALTRIDHALAPSGEAARQPGRRGP